MATNAQVLKCPVRNVVQGPCYEPGKLGHGRFFITGPVKTGKSSFGASIPRSFFFDYEDKLKFIPAQYQRQTMAGRPTNLKETEEMVDWLCEQKRKNADFPIDTIVWDTGDEFLSGILIPGLTDEMISKDDQLKGKDITDYGSSGGGSKGWAMVTNRFLVLLKKLYNAGYGWVVLGHVKETKQTIKQQGQTVEVTKTRPALNPATYGGLYRMAEYIGMTTIRNQVITPKKTITLPGGKEKEIADEANKYTIRKGVLLLQEKVGDSDALIGSNVTLPSEIIMELGEGFSQMETLYNEVVESNTSKSD